MFVHAARELRGWGDCIVAGVTDVHVEHRL